MKYRPFIAVLILVLSACSGNSGINSAIEPSNNLTIEPEDLPINFKYLAPDIEMADNTAIITGGNKLSGAIVMSSDLRASASLILAALIQMNIIKFI